MNEPAKSWWSAVATVMWIDEDACRSMSTMCHGFVQAVSEAEAIDLAVAGLPDDVAARTPTIHVFKCPEEQP